MRYVRPIIALVVLLAFGGGASQATASETYTTPALLQQIAGWPVRCYTTFDAYEAANPGAAGPLWRGMGGFVAAPNGESDIVIGLTPNVCRRVLHPLSRYQPPPVHAGIVFGGSRADPLPFALAAFTFAHEIAHVWQWRENRMWVFPPAAHQEVELAADCQAARHFSVVAYALGLRGHNNFVLVTKDAVKYGPSYSPPPAATCWRADEPLASGWDSP